MKSSAYALLVVAVLLTGCRETSMEGSEIYFSACSACHGVDLSGSVASALNAGSAAAALTDAEYRTVIRRGTIDMPSNTSLSDAQVDALVAYIRSVQTGP